MATRRDATKLLLQCTRLAHELGKTSAGNLDLMKRMVDRTTGNLQSPSKMKRLLALLEEGRKEEMAIEKRLDALVKELLVLNEGAEESAPKR